MDLPETHRNKRSRNGDPKRPHSVEERGEGGRNSHAQSFASNDSSRHHSRDSRHSSRDNAHFRHRDSKDDVEYHQGSSKRRKESDPHPSASFSTPTAPKSAVSATSGFVDFVMPQRTHALDDATYESVVETQLKALQKELSEEDEVLAMQERTRALLVKAATSALPSSQSTSSSITPSSKATTTPSPAQSASTGPSNVVKTVLTRQPAPSQRKSTTSLGLNPVDSDDDMFGDSFVDEVAPVPTPSHMHPATGSASSSDKLNREKDASMKDGGNAHAADDDEGYYSFRIGELLGPRGQYEVLGYFGKGVYSNVIRARRVVEAKKEAKEDGNEAKSPKSKEEASFAIKLLRNNAHMKRSGKKEVKVLKMLEEADPEGKCHCLKLIESFEEKGHLCLVFESLDMNLTEVVKLYGHNVGIAIEAVRSYAFKMLKALALLKRCNLIHSDIKPDNLLVSKDRKEVKLADFGTALESQEMELTNQLVSRFYRAPEIIIGLFPYSFPIDMFSIGCCLYEMATGKYLLPSESDNHHLKLCMEISGPFPKKLLSQCHPPFLNLHFHSSPSQQEILFLERFPDPLDPSRTLVRKLEMPLKPTRSILHELLSSYHTSNLSQKEISWIHLLADLITQCLALDPKKRITPEAALQHPLF